MAILPQQQLDQIKKAIPDYQCFIVGSCVIDNVESADVDVLVLIDEFITAERIREIRRNFYAICHKPEYALILNRADDNTKLKELFPYYDLKTDDHKYADKDTMTVEEYDILKMRLYNTSLKSKRYYKTRKNG